MGSSYDPAILKWLAVPARVVAREPLVHSTAPLKKARPVNKRKKLGPDLLAHFISSGPLLENSFHQLSDPIVVELEANTTFPIILKCVVEKGIQQEDSLMEKEDAQEDNEDTAAVEVMEKCLGSSETSLPLENSCKEGIKPQRSENNNHSLTKIEEAIPLN